MTNKAILIHGRGKRETERTVSALISLETGNLTAGISTLIRRFPCWGIAQPNLNVLSQHVRSCSWCSFRGGASNG